MKGKLFVTIILFAVAYTTLKYYGFFDGTLVEIQAAALPPSCNNKTIDMKVISASDTAVARQLNGKASLEIPFNQRKLNTWMREKLSDGDSSDFLVVGYLMEGRKLHCSGSVCFRVRQIKRIGDPSFTEL